MTAETPLQVPPDPGKAALTPPKGRALGAAMWLLTGFGGAQILRLVSNVILTRLLFAEAFGIMQLVTVFLIGLHLFSDIGIGPSVVQNEKGDDPLFLDTAWVLQIGRGVMLFTVGVLLSYPFAVYYREPSMLPILIAANVTSLITGFQSTKVFTASRHLAQKRLSLLELGSQAIGIGSTVVAAYVFREVWTLIVGSLVSDFCRVVGSHLLLPGERNRIRLSRPFLGEMLRFGRWIFLSTLLTFCVTQADRLVFGKLVPLGMLGIYGVAANIVAIPPTALGSLMHGVLFPMFASIVQSGKPLGAMYGRVRRPILIMSAWVMAGFVGGGSIIIEILYDERFHAAGPIVQVLALGGFFAILESSTSKALLALGQSHFMAAASAGKLAAMAVFIPVGHHFYGFMGACTGYAASELGRYAVSVYAAYRSELPTLRQDLGLTLLLIVAAGLSIGAVETLERAVAVPALVEAAVVFMVVTLAFGPLLRGVAREMKALRAARVVPPVIPAATAD